MSPRKRRLPSLKALLALESVLRTGSVTHAARELSVTHSAISKQLTQLEDWLGMPLFDDRRRKMTPSHKVGTLAYTLTAAFDNIQSALDELNPTPSSSLIIVAPATLAMRWLIPQLPQFTQKSSFLDIRVHPMHSQDSQEQISFDIAISRLNREEISPDKYCGFTEQLSLVIPASIYSENLTKDKLMNLPLLNVRTRDKELEHWLAGIGSDLTKCKKPITYAHFYQAYDAMLAGYGALVVPTFLIKEQLHLGDILEPFPENRIMGSTYIITTNSTSTGIHLIDSFKEWLVISFLKSGLVKNEYHTDIATC